MTEEWREIPSAPGYQVSSLGRVRSVDRTIVTKTGMIRRYKGQIIQFSSQNRMGHPKGWVRESDGNRALRYLHHLVAEAFIGPRPVGYQVAHGDGDPKNASLANLRYATPTENAADKKRHGTHRFRETHPQAKLTESQVADIRARLSRGEKQQSIADLHGVSRNCVSSIAIGKSWAEGPALTGPTLHARAL